MPAVERPVVVNATPIITLSLVGQLDLLGQLFKQVLIPPAVKKEVLAGKNRPGASDLRAAEWLLEKPVKDSQKARLLLSDLDRGEAEVLALALERNARLVILDERLGRWHARRLELPLTGTLGILLRGKEAKLLESVGPLIRDIRRQGIWLGDDLVRRALTLAGEVRDAGR